MDFIGVSDVYFGKVTEDSAAKYEAETPMVLSRTGEISQTTEQAQNVVYYSNYAAYAVNSKGATTISAVVEALALAVLAKLHGNELDSNGALIDSGEAKNLNFFLMFRADYVGEAGSRYYSFPKVTISIPDEATKTKDAGTDTLNQSLTITAVSTVHQFGTGANAKPCKMVICDTINNTDTAGKTKLDLSKWFDQAITPESLATIKAGA